VLPPLDGFYLNYRTCPIFGEHYTDGTEKLSLGGPEDHYYLETVTVGVGKDSKTISMIILERNARYLSRSLKLKRSYAFLRHSLNLSHNGITYPDLGTELSFLQGIEE
jgi:hypothetical protein